MTRRFSTVSIRRIADVVNGGTPGASEANWGGEIPWATPVDLGRHNGELLVRTDRNVTPRALTDGTRTVPSGSVLLSVRAPIGYSSITGAATAFNQGCKALVLRDEQSDARFLQYAIQASKSVLVSRGRGTTFLEVNSNEVSSLKIPWPSAAYQRLIADHLDRETAEIDVFIAEQLRFGELLDERWSTALIEGVQPQLLQEARWPHPDESGWKRMRLKSTITSLTGGAWGGEVGDDEVDARCIRVADFDKSSATVHDRNATIRSYPKQQVARHALCPNDLIIEKSGGGPKTPVGNVVLYSGPGGDLYSNFVARIRLAPGVEPKFATYLHRALYLSGVTTRSIKQSTGIQNLDTDSYFNERIALPPLGEQKRLGQLVDSRRLALDSSQALVSEAIALAKERRAALISAAVTGKIDVTEKQKPAAEQLANDLAEER